MSEEKRAAQELARSREELEQLVAERSRELEESRFELRRSERLAALGTFSAGIAHEINNPVGMMLLSAQNALAVLDERQAAEPELRTCLTHIVEAARRCRRITRDVLQFARQDPPERTPCQLAEILGGAVEATREVVAGRGGAVAVELGELPPIPADRVALEQVFVNLIENAVEATRGVRVDLSAEPADGGVRISVKDDGPGMSAESIRHIFDPFFTTRHEQGGTGLGLSLVHATITAHGGIIAVDSRPGAGVTFTIELPLGEREGQEHGESTDR